METASILSFEERPKDGTDTKASHSHLQAKRFIESVDVAHGLKGAASAVGAEALRRVAMDLENIRK